VLDRSQVQYAKRTHHVIWRGRACLARWTAAYVRGGTQGSLPALPVTLFRARLASSTHSSAYLAQRRRLICFSLRRLQEFATRRDSATRTDCQGRQLSRPPFDITSTQAISFLSTPEERRPVFAIFSHSVAFCVLRSGKLLIAIQNFSHLLHGQPRNQSFQQWRAGDAQREHQLSAVSARLQYQHQNPVRLTFTLSSMQP